MFDNKQYFPRPFSGSRTVWYSDPCCNLKTFFVPGSPLKPHSYDYVYRDIKPNVLLASITGTINSQHETWYSQISAYNLLDVHISHHLAYGTFYVTEDLK